MDRTEKKRDRNQTFFLAISLCFGWYCGGQTTGLQQFFIGNAIDSAAQPTQGVVLMGGGGESDEAMQWFLQQVNGGDVVVLRTSGGSGYQDYLYNQLGVFVNSVTTLVMNNRQVAFDSTVINALSRAEGVWIAGGDQSTYVNFWRNTPVDSLIQHIHHVKGGPIGGISAGLAIMGHHYYAALGNSVTSVQALQDPFHPDITLGSNDFLTPIFTEQLITDSHYDNPDRKGRHITFMARLMDTLQQPMVGIGVNEYTAVCIDANGIARVFGDSPNYPDDKAFFIRLNCATPAFPEVLQPGLPVTWNRGGQALKVFVAEGFTNGSVQLNLNDWRTTTGGGEWQDWYVESGVLTEVPNAQPPICDALTVSPENRPAIPVYPNPFDTHITITGRPTAKFVITDITGKALMAGEVAASVQRIELAGLPAGVYFLKLGEHVTKLVKQ